MGSIDFCFGSVCVSPLISCKRQVDEALINYQQLQAAALPSAATGISASLSENLLSAPELLSSSLVMYFPLESLLFELNLHIVFFLCCSFDSCCN